MKTKKWFACLALVLVSPFFAQPTTAAAATHTLEWTRQLGTSGFDVSNGVSSDGLGNVYISGYTQGSLNRANAGGADAFLSKYDSSGSLLWTAQLGTSGNDVSYGVSSDGLGNVYISGDTDGSLGGTNAGGRDAFLSKYDSDGNLIWTEQLGTSEWDLSSAVSSDGLGNVFISGYTQGSLNRANAGGGDAFLSKYDSGGNLLWTEQLGTSEWDLSYGVSPDGLGNVYILGNTGGNLDGTNAGSDDVFLSKYDSSGSLLWTEQFGTKSQDAGRGVSSDGLGNVYISGFTFGGGLSGVGDAFLNKYDSNGNLLWTNQLGTSVLVYGSGVSSDGLGNVYISGYTRGSLGGTNAGGFDAFVSKYDAGGTLLWTEQLGTSGDDVSFDVSSDGLGNVYISGSTKGSFGGPNAGGADAFISKFSDPIPEPSTLLLGAMASVGILMRRKRTLGKFCQSSLVIEKTDP